MVQKFIFIIFILLIDFLWLLPAQAVEPVKGQYVVIELPGEDRILSLAEVEVYKYNTNIARQGTSSQVNTFADASSGRAIDGNTAGGYFNRSVASTAKAHNAWWELNLGSEQPITKIIVYNRTDCCPDRINPGKVRLLDGSSHVVWEGTITTVKQKYEFETTPIDASLQQISPNILRNSTFQQRTNPSIPDYWDFHHIAAITLKNLHDQYRIDEQTASPVSGAKVLQIRNTEDDFSHLNLMPRRLFSPLRHGEFTFSVYLKANTNGMECKVTPAWAKGEAIVWKLTTEWHRFSVTFRLVSEQTDTLQPIMFFPSKGTYYISAPQLERGNGPSSFQPSYDDKKWDTGGASLKQQLKSFADLLSSKTPKFKEPSFSASFEYNYYTTQKTAHLTLQSQLDSALTVTNTCLNATKQPLALSIPSKLIIHPRSSMGIDVPISAISVGEYTCVFETLDNTPSASTAKLVKSAPGRIEVRTNSLRRFISINDKPFFVIGLGIGCWKTPPDWYFKDIADHGINTVFYSCPPNPRGAYDVPSLESFLTRAESYNIKAIIGIPLSGAKVADWRQRLSAFTKLAMDLKDNPTVIGWFPIDEPASTTWQDSDLREIYDTIKSADPYRLILINWAYDGVPPGIGQEPKGTLGSTDIYSIDYYPFAGHDRNMQGFAETSLRALLTAKIYHKVPHSWIQLYGGMDAWREPTGDEINYMVYLNLLYGSMISYWETKSNSRETWERLTSINREAQVLSEELFLNPEARELSPPVAINNFIYSIWKKGESSFMIVIHNGAETETFTSNLPGQIANESLRIKSLFEKKDFSTVDGQIQESFRPYESKVYVFNTSVSHQ